LLAPVQAVLEHNGKYYCVWKNAEGLVAKEVQLGATNDTHVVVKGGVTETDEVVLNPRAFLDQLNLPAALEIEPKQMLAATEVPVETQVTPAPGGPRGGGSGGMLSRFDKNGDGRLSQDEVSPQMASRFAMGDKNNDGFLDADEISALPPRNPGGGPGGPGGPGGRGRDGIGGGSGE
jgi:hypothetical protein